MGKTLGYGEITVANVTEPFTVMLTNEAQQFATDSNRKVTSAQSYYTDIIVIRGSQERTDYTIGNITSGSGITVSKNSKRVTFSVSAGTTIGADAGVIEIPITLDGQTVKKQFSWSCGKQGPQGVKGQDGNSFAWNMLSETNCGKKHWGTESSGGKYSVEDFITEDNIDAVKLICTEAISTSNWSYVSFKDIKMLKQLKPSTKYTLSYDIKANRSGAISHSICKGDVSNFCTNTVVVNNIIGNETWQHISVVLTTNDLKTTPTNEILYLGRNALSKVGYSIIKNLKLVEGDIDTPWSPSQSDIEGKGVVETVQYYLATSQASGVTSSTSGWSTDITTQKLTADKKYLWNCYQTKYSDGTSEPISTPKVIGVYGDKGANALQCKRNWTGTYTTINGTTSAALSDFNRTPVAGDVFTTLDGSSNTGTWQVISVSGSNVNIKLLSYVNSRGEKGDNAKNLSITPSSQYFKSTDGGKTFAPNVITIKPTIQGEISFGKWQYSIDGGVSFTDVVSGQKGLTISNNVLTVSKDSSLYSDAVTMVTFRAVASDSSFYDTCSIAKIYDVNDIGDGRNLLLNTSSYRESNPLERTGSNTDDYSTYPKIITSIDLSANQKYTLQAKTDSNWATKHDIGGHTPSEKLVGLWLVSDDTNTFLDMSKGYAIFTAPKTTKYKLRVNQYSNGTDAYTIHLWDIKLEKGQSASGWSAAPEDVQTAILSTKSEISDVSLKVDNNKQAIEQRVEKTTYEQDLTLVKGDIGKANEGLNKWRYEIYPKSLFTSEYQGKSTMDVFAKNTNLTPSQSVLINDMDLSIAWNYDNNYIGYALTFAKFSAAKSVAITFAHDDGAHIYLNGKLIGGSDAYSQTGESLTLGFVKGWNCIEVVVNEGDSTEGFKLGTTISAISECQLMNCYYGTPVARQSHITNQLVENTTNINGISTKVSKVTSVIGDNGENFTSFKNDYSDFKQTMNGFKTTVGQTYVTKDDFNGLEIGGVNLFVKSTASRGWWISNTGVLNADGGWGYSDYIDVSGMKNYIASGFTNLGISPATCFYDSNKTFISGVASKNQNSQDSKRKTLPIPSNAKYMRFSFALADIDTLKIEQGTKATAYSPAPEDDEINGQNLVSNLPSNWEQGSINYTANLAYGSLKSTLVSRLRTKDVFPVSGNITISAGTSTNSSKEELNFYYVLFDINKKSISHGDTWQSLTSPKIINCGDAKYMAIILRWGSGSTVITPSDISQICLKIERGTSATPFTLAPEDVNGKIVNVETIANQTAKKFEWIVKGGDSSSNFTLTDRVADLVAERINFNGLVKFSGLNTDAKNEIGKVAQSKVDGLEVGGRNLLVQKNITQGYLATDGKGSFINSGGGDQTSDWIDVSGNKYITITLYEDFTNTNNSGRYCEYDADKNCISTIDYNPRQKSSVIIELKSNTKYIRVTAIECKTRRYKIEAGNKATDWTPAPEDVSQDATNKASQALTDAKNYSSSAVNWVTNNGSSTTSLNSMVKKWTDGAVSDTAQINGGWIKANTITASKIAIGDFTNYCDDPYFENGMYTGGGTFILSTEQKYYGTRSMKMCAGTNAYGSTRISQDFELQAGEKIYVEYYVYRNDANHNAGVGIYSGASDYGAVVYDINGQVLASSNIANKTWTKVSYIATANRTGMWAACFKHGSDTALSGDWYLDNVTITRMTTGELIVDGSITADKIATDAIKSRNYISSGGTQGSFLNLSDGSFTSPNLSWDANGNLIAKNANLSGEITATKGSIGGWNIGDTSLFTGITKSNVRIYDAVNADNAQNMYQKEQHSLILANTYINSFNSSLNSSDNYWHAQGVTINDGEFQVGETLYNPNLVNSDKDEVYYDRGLTRVFGGYITMSRDCSINSDSRSLYADIILNGEELYICTNRNILFSPLRTSIFTTEDPSKYNAIETTGDAIIGGNMVLRDRSNGNHKVAIYPYDGCIEMYGNAPYIDFHYGSTTSDYTSRIIAQSGWDCLTFTGSILLGGDIYNSSNGHYTWDGKTDAYLGCGNYSGGNNIYYYANYHAFYVNNDLGSGMMYINTNGVTSRVGFTKTSDERIKKNFESFDDNIIDAYMNIEPVKYQLKQSSNDNYHFGFKAQHIDKIFSDYGDTYNESFDICTSRPIDPDKAKELYGVDGMVEEYGLRYDELIAPTTYMVQHIYKELEQVKQEKADLETRLQAIEAKLRL